MAAPRGIATKTAGTAARVRHDARRRAPGPGGQCGYTIVLGGTSYYCIREPHDPTKSHKYLVDEYARPTLRGRPEKEIQAEIIRLLRAHGIPAWKVGAGAFKVGDRYVKMGQKGMSDIVAVHTVCIRCVLAQVHAQHTWWGRFLGIEVKRVGRRPTIEQSAFLDQVRRAGGLAFVASSCDDVVRELHL